MGNPGIPTAFWTSPAHGELMICISLPALPSRGRSHCFTTPPCPRVQTSANNAHFQSHLSPTRKEHAATIPQGSHTGVEAEFLLQELGIGWQKCCTGLVLFQLCPKTRQSSAPEQGSCKDFCGKEVGRQHWCHWGRMLPVTSPEPITNESS